MFLDDRVAGSWYALAARVEASGTLHRWAAAEPPLLGMVSLDAVVSATARGAERARSDAVVGALVRLAARDGGDEDDAVLVLLHLLSDGATRLVRFVPVRGLDGLRFVTAELTAQIRGFPWRRRTRAYAANLLRDTQAALLSESATRQQRRLRIGPDLLVDPLDPGAIRLFETPLPHSDHPDDDIDIVELLQWAAVAGVARPRDLALLIDLELEPGPGVRQRVASKHGVHERTVRRRQARTLAALRQARSTYLRDVG